MITAHDHSPAAPVRFAIPVAELTEFAQLPSEVRADVNRLLVLFNEVAAQPGSVVDNLKLRAAESTRRGMSFGALKTKFYALRKEGWRALVNQTKARTGTAEAQPEAFIQHWRALIERNQRKSKPAYRELVRAWNKGEFIPGYGTWRDHWRRSHDTLPPDDARFVPDLPAGWSYENLLRYGSTKLELAAARQGLAAARKFAPGVLTTRAGLEVGQFYVFDDVWHDHKIAVLGWTNQAVRPLELGCLDLHSASRFAYGIRPILPKMDGTEDRIKEAEMRFFVASVLMGTGYREAGTTLVVEHGTAAIREDMERQLYDMSGGRIRVERSGIDGKAQLGHLFEGRGRGNFKSKTWLESLHNLMHNEMAALPGQVGKDRDHSPEELHGREKRHELLARAMHDMPPELAAQLRLPFLTLSQFMDAARRIYDLIDTRTDHELEGWQECGHVRREVRIAENMPWLDVREIAALPPAERAVVQSFASLPGRTRTVQLSPREVWARGSAGLVRLNPALLPELLGDLGKREVRVADDHTITFRDHNLGPGDLAFDTVMNDGDGRRVQLRAGEKFLAYFSPFAPTVLTLCNAKGGWLGVVQRINRVRKDDLDALHREMGRRTHQFKELIAPVAARGGDIMRKEIEAVRHNAAVLAAATENQRPADMRTAGRVSAEAVNALTQADPLIPRPALETEPEDPPPSLDDIGRFLS